ncbi:MAG: hydantoinase B/oxoprolinase family protein, partial [Steroidobacteraceae bacterium]
MNGADLTVLSHRFDGIARKMANVLLRTGRSGVLNRAKDLSCCIVSRNCELVSAAESLPIHVLSGPDLMAKTMHRYHPALRRGDAFLENSPYHGCSHSADHTIIVPVIDESGNHQFTVMAKAHQADIGNSQPTTYFASAVDVYQEGALIFPSVKVQEGYRMIEDVVRMCEMRIRVPQQWHGDFLAMIGAARVGEQALLDLGAEFGWDLLQEFATEWLDYGEQRMMEVIRALPAGSGSATSTHDPMTGTPAEGLMIKSTVFVEPDAATIRVDLTDNPDCIPSGLNLSEACSRSAAYLGVLNSIGADLPRNGGALRRIKVDLRENCIVGVPVHPTSCSLATTNIADRATAATQKAFAEIGENLGMAEVGAINPPAKGVLSGVDPRTGKRFINQLFLGSTGGPGTAEGDAWLTYSHVGNGAMAYIESIEMAELHHPILVRERALLPDSEGAGKHCGAPSLRISLEALDTSLTLVYASDGTINRAAGIRGGLAGGAAAQYLIELDDTRKELPPASQLLMQPGQLIVSIGTGGGGYGPPAQRDPHRVAADVRAGLISQER